MQTSEFYRLKCVVVGNSNVGKSSLVKLLHSTANPNVETTIGAAFVSMNIELKEFPLELQTQTTPNKTSIYKTENMNTSQDTNQNKHQKIKVDIWDIAGSPRYNSLLSVQVRDVDICFLTFSLNDRESWWDLTNWYNKISQYKKEEGYPIFVLIANKCDLNWTVSIEEMERQCEIWKCKYYCLSAFFN